MFSTAFVVMKFFASFGGATDRVAASSAAVGTAGFRGPSYMNGAPPSSSAAPISRMPEMPVPFRWNSAGMFALPMVPKVAADLRTAYGSRAGSATLPPTLVYVFVEPRVPKVLQVGGMSAGTRERYIASFCGTGTGWGIRL